MTKPMVVKVTKTEFELDNGNIYPIPFQWSFIQGATPEQIDVMADEFAYELKGYKETDARYCTEQDVKKYADDVGYEYPANRSSLTSDILARFPHKA